MDEDDIMWDDSVPAWTLEDYLDSPPVTPPAGGLSEIEGDERDPWDY